MRGVGATWVVRMGGTRGRLVERLVRRVWTPDSSKVQKQVQKKQLFSALSVSRARFDCIQEFPVCVQTAVPQTAQNDGPCVRDWGGDRNKRLDKRVGALVKGEEPNFSSCPQ